jgi:hypothetical protein
MSNAQRSRSISANTTLGGRSIRTESGASVPPLMAMQPPKLGATNLPGTPSFPSSSAQIKMPTPTPGKIRSLSAANSAANSAIDDNETNKDPNNNSISHNPTILDPTKNPAVTNPVSMIMSQMNSVGNQLGPSPQKKLPSPNRIMQQGQHNAAGPAGSPAGSSPLEMTGSGGGGSGGGMYALAGTIGRPPRSKSAGSTRGVRSNSGAGPIRGVHGLAGNINTNNHNGGVNHNSNINSNINNSNQSPSKPLLKSPQKVLQTSNPGATNHLSQKPPTPPLGPNHHPPITGLLNLPLAGTG